MSVDLDNAELSSSVTTFTVTSLDCRFTMTASKTSITASILGADDSTVLTVAGYDEGTCGSLTFTATMTELYPTLQLESFLEYD